MAGQEIRAGALGPLARPAGASPGLFLPPSPAKRDTRSVSCLLFCVFSDVTTHLLVEAQAVDIRSNYY